MPQPTWPSHRASGPAEVRSPTTWLHPVRRTSARAGERRIGRKSGSRWPVAPRHGRGTRHRPLSVAVSAIQASTFARCAVRTTSSGRPQCGRDQRVAHAYLFSGPRGTGKTSTARILAKALNCTDLHDAEPCGVCSSCIEIAEGTSLDVHELDAASNNGVEAMRDWCRELRWGLPVARRSASRRGPHALHRGVERLVEDARRATRPCRLRAGHTARCCPPFGAAPRHRVPSPRTRDAGRPLEQVRRDAGLSVPDEALDLAVRPGRARRGTRSPYSTRSWPRIRSRTITRSSTRSSKPWLSRTPAVPWWPSPIYRCGIQPQQLTGDLIDHLRQGFLALVAPELVGVSGSERQALAAQADRVGLAALVRAMEVLGESQVAIGRPRPTGQPRSGPGATGPPRGGGLSRGDPGPH